MFDSMHVSVASTLIDGRAHNHDSVVTILTP